MSQYNIEMNSFNGSSYDQLYPQTLLNNISDWANNIYSKTEIDNVLNSFLPTSNSAIVSSTITVVTPKAGQIIFSKSILEYKTLCVRVYHSSSIPSGYCTISVGNSGYVYLDKGKYVCFLLIKITTTQFFIIGSEFGSSYDTEQSSTASIISTGSDSTILNLSVSTQATDNYSITLNVNVYGY